MWYWGLHTPCLAACTAAALNYPAWRVPTAAQHMDTAKHVPGRGAVKHSLKAVNDNTVLCDKQTYELIDSAVALLKPGYYMAKVDIKAEYRAVTISPSSYAATGLQWSIDGILPTSSTLIFHLETGPHPA